MMTCVKVRALCTSALALLLCLEAKAEGRWRIEAESPRVSRHAMVKTVLDTEASGGEALEVPSNIEGKQVVLASFPRDSQLGRYRISLRLKTTDLLDLGKGWRVEVREEGTMASYDVVYGYYLKGQRGYQDFAFDCECRKHPPEISMHWSGQQGKPTLYLDAIDLIRTGDAAPVRLKRVWPDRLRYLPGQNGHVTVTVESSSSRSETVHLRLELIHDFDNRRSIGDRELKIGPGRTVDVAFPLTNLTDKYGYEVRALLEHRGKVLDERSEYFTVHDDLWAIAQSGSWDIEPPEPIVYWHHTITMGGGHTDEEILKCVEIGRRQKFYGTAIELGRMPEEALCMAPAEPMWMDNQAGLLNSRHEMKLAVAALKRHGIGVVLYLSPYAWGGPHLMRLLKERPQWFAYYPPATSEAVRHMQDKDARTLYEKRAGDIRTWYEPDDMARLARFWESFSKSAYHGYVGPGSPNWKGTQADWDRYKRYWGRIKSEFAALQISPTKAAILLNMELPEVVDHIADQIVASVRMFGWDAVRWDGNTGVFAADFGWPYVPFYDFHGNPLNATVEEAIQQTLKMMRRLRTRVAKELPNLVCGYNFGSWAELNRYPELTREMCRDGGWMLDEWAQWYNRPAAAWDDVRVKTEPYNVWESFYAVMSDAGDLVARLGGHYHPFVGGMKYPPDDIYAGIFGIAGKGHISWGGGYLNPSFVTGNRSQFTLRFGRFIFERNLRRVDHPEEIVSVVSSAPIWWKKSVYRLSAKETEHLVIHVINPPASETMEGDPNCHLRDPADNVLVGVELPEKRTKARAWVLTPESWTLGEKARTQAVPLHVSLSGRKASVTVPQVLFWKIVAFRFE